MSEARARPPRPRRRDELLDKKQDLLFSWSNEVCNNEEVPEVEIVSLLQEHIPKYRLRADSLTKFGGYENQDWFIPSPALQLGPQDLALSTDQIRETLNYFLLCSNRVSQMTKTYNDIEAVTRLLEEKEKDLELTARIGKELLSANGRLEARVGALEGELRAARDHVTQLRHELSSKSELLQVLTNDTDDGEWNDISGSDVVANAEALARRTGALERENKALREEASRLAAGADDAENKERALLRDIAHQLASSNSESNCLASQLTVERERTAQLQQELQTSASRLTNTQRGLAQLTAEHEHTLQVLEITRENQSALASELADLKERYAEVMSHLAEAQEQLRALRRRGETAARSGGLMPSVALAAGLMPSSLHHELHSSIYSDLSLDSGISDPMHTSSVKKVFETVQCASRWSGGSLSSCGSDATDSVDGRTGARPARRPLSLHSDDSVIDDSNSDTDSDEMYPGGTGGSGVPGAPGAAELAAALRRLTPAEISSRRAALHASHLTNRSYAESEGSAVWGVGGAGRWRLPNKLQIVKPIEGSHTLHTWAQLAKPNMSGLLEEHEGVGVRGARSAAALGLQLYRLSDVEEDDDLPRLPYASHVYTLTDSMVMHPNDGSMSSSTCSSAMSSAPSSVLGSAWSSRRSSAAVSPTRTPRRGLSRRDSFAVPPEKPRFSPTATPANSPLLNSPESSPPPSPKPGDAPSLHALISSGTSILRREFGAERSPLALQTPGSLYTGLVHRSPMEQLTCLKRALHSPAARGEERSDALGVPGAPGSGALETAAAPAPSLRARGGRGARVPRPRTDLGTVGPAQPPVAPVTAPYSSPLGTLSSLLFGRKGGLL